MDWEPALDALAAGPRENGTAALFHAADWLEATLAGSGIAVELVPFTAHPYALRLAGVAILASAAAVFVLLRRGEGGRPAALALAIALLTPVLLLAELDYGHALLGRVGAQVEYHVEATLPAEVPDQRIVLAAHYDTKTDVFDHVERAPVDLLGGPVALLLVIAAALALRGRRAGRAARTVVTAVRWVGLAYGVAAFATLSAGAFVPARSPGALDDGAACAVLLGVADSLARTGPLARTEVVLVWLAAEEVGVQGSPRYVAERLALLPPLPTRVVNLEGIGASETFLVLGGERFSLRSYPPAPEVLALLDGEHEARYDAPVPRTPFGGATDARSFLAAGIPAATLVSRAPGEAFTRGLHSQADRRERIAPAALDATLELLLGVLARADREGP